MTNAKPKKPTAAVVLVVEPSKSNETATDRRNWLRKQAGWPVKGNS